MPVRVEHEMSVAELRATQSIVWHYISIFAQKKFEKLVARSCMLSLAGRHGDFLCCSSPFNKRLNITITIIRVPTTSNCPSTIHVYCIFILLVDYLTSADID